MVRVFKCHGFKSSTVVPVADEPTTVFTDGCLVFVATKQCNIKVFKKNASDDGFSEWKCISTICMVEKMVYNKTKDYILTLEQKKSWKSVLRYVRLYLHWSLDRHKTTKQRTKVRIAGRAHTLHSSKDYLPHLEVIDLPLEGAITAVNVCQANGNFAVAQGREVTLYHIVEKTVANWDRTYKDVEPFLELYWNFEVISLSISEEFLACCSNTQVQVVTVGYGEAEGINNPRPSSRVQSSAILVKPNRATATLEKESPGQQILFLDDVQSSASASEGVSNYSPSTVSFDHSVISVTNSVGRQSTTREIVEDENYVEWSFEVDDTLVDKGEEFRKESPRIIYLESLHQGSPHPQTGATPPVLRDVRGGSAKTSSGVSAKTVLHLSDIGEQESWLSVTLIPAYVPEDDQFSHVPLSELWSNPVHSSLLPNRRSLCCYISTRRGGYLYSLHPGVSHVSTYRYSDDAYCVRPGLHLLHVVTSTGLETYTARWGAVALAVTEGLESRDEARPSSGVDICMCGIEPFMGAVDLSARGDIIALLTRIEAHKGQDDSQWNLYILQNCTVEELYKDMVSFASRIQETGPSSYLHLLQEAHLLVRWELCRHAGRDQRLVDLFHESCALLGEFYSWPGQDDWHLCAPYYKKSGLGVADIVRQAVQNRLHTIEQLPVYQYGQGVMQYLDWALFQSEVDLQLTEDLSNTLLQIYTQNAPESLPSVLLLSRLEGYSPERALLLLADLTSLKESSGEQTSAMDRLASVKVHLLMCDPASAEMVLSSIDKVELVEICTSHPELVHGGDGFTPLAQLMRCHTPGNLLLLLAEIVSQGDLTLDGCLNLLEKSCEASRCRNNQLREFLEILLSDLKRKMWFEEAAMQLCEIYVRRLLLFVELQPTSYRQSYPPKFSLPSGTGHFASRFPWLDYLPPVTSPACLKTACQRMAFSVEGHSTASLPVPGRGKERGSGEGMEGRRGEEEVCSCALCVQDLLKLQSLLCSKHATPELYAHVRKLISGRPDMTGWDTVWILCTFSQQPREVLEFCVDRYPHIVGKLAVTVCGQDLEKWRLLLSCMEARLKEHTHGGDKKESQQNAILSAYQDVLGELVERFTVEEFLMSLPADGSLWFLLPFVTRCLQRKHLEELKVTITEKGKSLLNMLNP